jgi:hypothetical protein
MSTEEDTFKRLKRYTFEDARDCASSLGSLTFDLEKDHLFETTGWYWPELTTEYMNRMNLEVIV